MNTDNTILADWQALLSGLVLKSNKLVDATGKEIISEEQLSKLLYSNYKNKSLTKAPSFKLIDFSNKLIKKIYPENVSDKWQIKKINTDELSFIIRKAYTERGVTKDNCILSDQTETLSLDSEVDILLKKAYSDAQNNLMWIYGRFYPTDNNDELIRYYFNFSLNIDNLFAFERFLCSVIVELNIRGISFQLKFVDDISMFNRADSLVIYIEKFHYLASFECIKQCYLEAKPYLIEDNAKTPLFTHKIADGWGFAEEPKTEGVNLSFGEERTSSIARFVWLYIDRKKPISLDTAEIYQLFIAKYNQIKYDFSNFHLHYNPYSQPPSIVQIKRPILSKNDFPKFTSSTDDWAINAANIIGFHLCRQAIWGSDQDKEFKVESIKTRKCTWLNAEIGSSATEKDFYTVKSVDAGLGNGLAGILYFLVKLYEIQKSETLLNTIHGAMNNLFDKYEKLGDNNSLFKGKIGILLVLNGIAKVKGFEGLINEVNEKIKALAIPNSNSLDFYNGLSGQIWGLVLLHKSSKDDTTKTAIKALLLQYKVVVFKDIITNTTNYNSGLNGLAGIALMLASLTIFLYNIGDNVKGNDCQSKARAILDKIVSQTKGLDNSIESGWGGVLIALIGGRVQLKDQPHYISLISEAQLNISTYFLNAQKKDDKTFAVNTGFLGTILSLKFYEVVNSQHLLKLNTPYLSDFMKSIYDEKLQKQNLPPMGFNKKINNNTRSEYHNPGFLNGISGLGLMFLKFRNNSENPLLLLDQIVKPI